MCTQLFFFPPACRLLKFISSAKEMQYTVLIMCPEGDIQLGCTLFNLCEEQVCGIALQNK